MHELSITRALMGRVRQHTPADAVVQSVRVRIGPLQAIEPQAMELAWRAATQETFCQDAALELETLPWQLHCPACDRRWDSDDPLAECLCGYDRCQTKGSDELVLVSLKIKEPGVIKEA